MKKFYALAVALFLGVIAFAQTHSVTFQVDLGSASANSNGVHVAGSFQSWSPSTTGLTQVGTSSIYSTTVSHINSILQHELQTHFGLAVLEFSLVEIQACLL